MGWVVRQCKLRYKYRKRTRTITSVLDEGYVRDDIPCGLQGCPTCVGLLAPPAHVPLVLPPTPTTPLVIPDGPSLQQYLELWELPEVLNVLITTTATQQFQLRAGLRQVARLRALYRDRRRQVHLFDDRHCAWTAGHHGSEALQSVAQFYCDHLPTSADASVQACVVVVSDSLSGNLSPEQLATHFQRLSAGGVERSPPAPAPPAPGRHSSRAQGFIVMTPAEYFLTYYRESPVVQELAEAVLQARLSRAQAKAADTRGSSGAQGSAGAVAGAAGAGTDWAHRQFLPQHVLEEVLESGQVLRGVLHVSQKGRGQEAVVHVGSSGSDMGLGALVRVSGRQHLGRVMHGDRVAVALLPSQPGSEPQAMSEDPSDMAGSTQPHSSEAGAQEAAAAEEAEQSAGGQQVLGVLETGESVGLMSSEPEGQEVDAATLVSTGGITGLPSGEVVGLLARDTKPLVASLSPGDEQALRSMMAEGSGGQQRREAVLVVPYDRRFPLVRLRTRHPARLMGQRLVVAIDDWPLGSKYPEGHVVRVLGPVNTLKAESEAVLQQAGIVHQPFCDAALAELPSVPEAGPRAWRPSPEERAYRRDLTGAAYHVCSIDPVGCTDVDDALHVRFLEGGRPGRVEVGVHIADVSFFVVPNSVLDMEAADRCTSVYLVDRRLDMLPGLLSEQLCSLLAGVERYAVSVLWTLELEEEGVAEGQLVVKDIWFGRTIIKSRHQLHYQQAQDILDGVSAAPGDALPSEDLRVLLPSLRLLKRLTDQLKGVRLANGALELESAEFRFKTNSSDGSPTEVISKAKIPMMDVIAEMMIAANGAVAEKVARCFPGAALLRCHPPPLQQALDQIRELLSAGHTPDAQQPSSASAIAVDLSSNKAFSEALAGACGRMRQRDAAAAQLIKGLATRAMAEAKYFSTGSAPPGTAAAYHYGLALEYYTHFTSPIRRYADILVHRQLLAALAAEFDTAVAPAAPIPHAQLVLAADRMNEQHRNAKRASQLCAELYLLLLLHKSPHVESALVVGLKEDGWVELYIPTFQMRARMPMRDGRGLVRRPLESGPLTEALVDSSDAFTLSARRQLVFRLGTDKQSAQVTDSAGLQSPVLWEGHVWGRVWVVLGAQEDASHGPRLCLRPISPHHPTVAGRHHPTATALPDHAAMRPAPTPHQQLAAMKAGHPTPTAVQHSTGGSSRIQQQQGRGRQTPPQPADAAPPAEIASDTPMDEGEACVKSCVTQAVLTSLMSSQPDAVVAARVANKSMPRRLMSRMAQLEAKLSSACLSPSNRRARWAQELETLAVQARQL